MLSLLKKHQLVITSFILCLISLQLVFLDIRGTGGPVIVGRVVSIVSIPIQSVTTGISGAIKSLWDDYIYLINLKEENKLLKNDIDILKEENNRLREAALASSRLMELLDLKNEALFPTAAARVTGVNTAGWTKTITLNKGYRKGLDRNMAVIGPQGIIGRIEDVKPNSSEVLLITDPRFRIDVVVQRTRLKGIVEGSGNDELNLKYIRQLDDIQAGDTLVSGGLGGIFPKGIIVGTVKEATGKEDKFFKTIKVIPSADLTKIEEVLVVINKVQ